jgi:hypothetical protein
VIAQNGAKWPGDKQKVTVKGGISGVILDLRGRPLDPEQWPEQTYQKTWLDNLCRD